MTTNMTTTAYVVFDGDREHGEYPTNSDAQSVADVLTRAGRTARVEKRLTQVTPAEHEELRTVIDALSGGHNVEMLVDGDPEGIKVTFACVDHEAARELLEQLGRCAWIEVSMKGKRI